MFNCRICNKEHKSLSRAMICEQICLGAKFKCGVQSVERKSNKYISNPYKRVKKKDLNVGQAIVFRSGERGIISLFYNDLNHESEMTICTEKRKGFVLSSFSEELRYPLSEYDIVQVFGQTPHPQNAMFFDDWADRPLLWSEEVSDKATMPDKERLAELINVCVPGKSLQEVDGIVDYLISNGTTINSWVSVKESLPSSGVLVLVVSDNGIVWLTDKIVQSDRGFWCKEANRERYDSSKSGYITHWMPLTQPRKQDEKDM